MLSLSRCILETSVLAPSVGISAEPLFAHQDREADFIVKRGGTGALFWDPGTGKTRGSLEISLRLGVAADHTHKIIVICPKSLLEDTWGDNIRKYTNLTYYNAHDNVLPRERIKEDMLLINFDAAIQSKNAHLEDHIRESLLIVDESSRMKNSETKTTQLLLKYSKYAKNRIIMSGTPACAGSPRELPHPSRVSDSST
jgi:hypothetical protein